MSFQSNQENPDSYFAKYVGRALDAPNYNPYNPQEYLEGSHHPYAPFTGNAYTWESWVYDDGTTYEGLAKEDVPHNKGVMIMGERVGAGIQKGRAGDMYEGEFEAGWAHGLGMYSSAKGELYKGEYLVGKRHGCGVLYDLRPLYSKIKKGVSPAEAWQQTQKTIQDKSMWGTWDQDFFVSEPTEDARYCHLAEVMGTLIEVDDVVMRSRMFRWKPDGEATYRNAQDTNGTPINTMQHPILYPHSTGFMAPGPMGQAHPLPDDENIRNQMYKHAVNFQRIHDSYNLDYEVVPGSDLDRAMKWHEQEEIRKDKRQKAAEERYQRRLKSQQMRYARESSKKKKGEDEPPEEEPPPPPPGPAAPAPPPEEQEEISEEDLLVSDEQGGKFGSVTLGINRATRIVHQFFKQNAIKAQRFPRLSRPQ
eukprot:TRINITY_DN4845_c0_g1_i12.p2 TRINITY_DN4845_c0_g1~~TRINITY_DN4845_c0_g1_i12.p2  ORF type:complete len:420 (+),score=92.78 TRINITY_DN4845_c0_g1_i12:938-2197(+)